MKQVIVDNITYKVGQNAKENTQMIHDSDKDWYWFHLDKFPSCHVIICSNEITNDMILQAGTLVKENSKYKFKNIGINYCKIDNLIHGSEPGSVSFKSNRQVKLFNL
jgi:predicted ribosome quality control (RQC) complex YloA/Tae2 family protein